jgi:hypothetical protein
MRVSVNSKIYQEVFLELTSYYGSGINGAMTTAPEAVIEKFKQNKDLAPALCTFINDDVEFVNDKAIAVKTLGLLNNPGTIQSIREAIDFTLKRDKLDNGYVFFLSAANALGEFKDNSTIPVLDHLLKLGVDDPMRDEFIREPQLKFGSCTFAIFNSLYKHGNKSAQEVLKKFIKKQPNNLFIQDAIAVSKDIGNHDSFNLDQKVDKTTSVDDERKTLNALKIKVTEAEEKLKELKTKIWTEDWEKAKADLKIFKNYVDENNIPDTKLLSDRKIKKLIKKKEDDIWAFVLDVNGKNFKDNFYLFVKHTLLGLEGYLTKNHQFKTSETSRSSFLKFVNESNAEIAKRKKKVKSQIIVPGIVLLITSILLIIILL